MTQHLKDCIDALLACEPKCELNAFVLYDLNCLISKIVQFLIPDRNMKSTQKADIKKKN